MKKGFTLVELLAVVVILALIALIATPVILNIKKSVEMGAFKASAYGILKSADLYYTSNVLLTGEKIASINVLEKDSNGEYLLRYEGQAPEQGIIMYNENSKSALSMKQDIWCAQKGYDDEEIKVYEVGKDGDCLLPGEEPTLKDENPGIICGISDIEEYDLIETCYIKSVEDLVAFSNLVNSGKTFKNKNVIVLKDLDIKNSKSYENKLTTVFGDINQDGMVQGLQEELNNYFPIIGDNNYYFSGNFDGNNFTISNITINVDSSERTNYIGLFGYNAGTIENINLDNINIEVTGTGTYIGSLVGYKSGTVKAINATNIEVNASSSNYVGGLVGYNITGTLTEVTFEGNVTGNKYVGGVVGNNSSTVSSIIMNGNVTGNQYVGGLSGYGSSPSGIVESGNITGNSYAGALYTYYSGGILGNYYAINSSTKAFVLKGVTVNGTDVGTYEPKLEDRVNLYEYSLDTWIGGDNDSSGYYFDYDETGKLVIKKVSESPLAFALSGEGTEENPYLVGTVEEWKQMTLVPQYGYYFKLTNDIDFNGQYFYMLGSIRNYFNGYLDGDNYTLKNITLEGYQDVGIIGYNNGGTVTNLVLENNKIYGYSNVGTLFGYNTGTLTDENNITYKGTNEVIGSGLSSNNIGGLIGYNAGTIENITLTTNNLKLSTLGTDTITNIGGFIGYNTASMNGIKLNNISLSLNSSVDKVGGFIGYNYNTSSIIEDIYMNNINIEVTGTGTYIGSLVGYKSGTVKAINATNIEVNASSSNYVGGLVGYNITGTLTEVTFEGNVTGNKYVGGVVGNNSSTVSSIIMNGNVTGNKYVGGLSGYGSSPSGIVESGNITGNSYAGALYTYYSGGILGNYYAINSSTKAFVLKGVTVNGTDVGTIDESYYNDLEYYGSLISSFDTVYSGDNNSSGYYFDYNDSKSDIIIKKVTE